MRYLIVGNGIASVRAAEAIRRWTKTASVTIVGDEPETVYSRPLIHRVLAGEKPAQSLVVYGPDWFKSRRILLLAGERAVELRAPSQEVVLASGNRLAYDRLLVATGASPMMPPVEGKEKAAVFGFRTLGDIRQITHVKEARRAVVLGSGPVALLAAEALRKRGLHVRMVVRRDQVLRRILDGTAAGIVQRRLEDNGIEVLTCSEPAGVVGSRGNGTAVCLTDGRELRCDLAVAATGVNPNVDLLPGSGVGVERGVPVDEHMRTNLPNVWAAGDVTETTDLLTGRRAVSALWPTAAEQGRVAGENMVGIERYYEGYVPMNSLHTFGLPCIVFGRTTPMESEQAIVDFDPSVPRYRKVVLDGGRVVWYIGLGDVSGAGVYLWMLRRKVVLPEWGDDVLKMDYARVLGLDGNGLCPDGASVLSLGRFANHANAVDYTR